MIEEVRDRLNSVEASVRVIEQSIVLQEHINADMKARQEKMDQKLTDIHDAFTAAKGAKWVFYSVVLPALAFIGAKVSGLFELILKGTH